MRNVPFSRSLPVRLLFRRRSMVADWDLRARTNAAFYVFREACGDSEAFAESGRRALAGDVLAGVDLLPDATVVEIGCGIGRLTKELAPRVGRIIAGDISPEMLDRARERCTGISNIEFARFGGDLAAVPAGWADFVFSHLVFQHLPGRTYIRRYLAEALRVLKPGGTLRANADGRVHHWYRRLAADSWSGVVLSERGWRDDLERAGFEVVETSGAGTQYLRGTARKPVVARSREGDFEAEGRQEFKTRLESVAEK